MNIFELAQILDEAAQNASPVPQLSLTHSFSETDAYAIQKASIDRRIARGEKLVGIKMGFTSEAKMKQMGVHDMIWGLLTDEMLIPNHGEISFDKFIHPRAEPELCFLTKKVIDRQITRDEIPEFIEGVAPAIEIIDSRYQNFKFSLEDVIADNCSSAGLVIGKWYTIDTPIGDLNMDLKFGEEIVQSGSSAAILGDPWKSLLAATRLAAQYGLTIPIGSFIMAGAATPAMYLEVGKTVSAVVENLGEVGFRIS